MIREIMVGFVNKTLICFIVLSPFSVNAKLIEMLGPEINKIFTNSKEYDNTLFKMYTKYLKINIPLKH